MALDKKNLNPLLKWLWDLLSFYSAEEISVPTDYHLQVAGVKGVLESDISGIVNSMLDYAISSASADYTVETDNEQFTEILNTWLSKINIQLLGKLPVGINAFAKEYFRERWKNSSLVVVRSLWEDVTINSQTFHLPTKLWLVDGINIEVKDANKFRIIGDESYRLKYDENNSIALPAKKNESIFVQKPFASWTSLYPTPYIISRGIWKNLMIYDLINKKGERFVGKALEYMLLMKKGTENLALKGDASFIYSEEDLKKAKDDLKSVVSDNKSEAGTPVYSTNFDTEFEHFIPDYKKLLDAALFTSVETRILAGLGLVEIVEGVASSRREAILNPKPFQEEVHQGMKDFSVLIKDILLMVIEKNKTNHPKYVNAKVKVSFPPVLAFMTDSIRDHLLSMYDRGLLSKATYTELVGQVDFDIEVMKRKTEKTKKLDDVMAPPVIQNTDNKDTTIQAPANQIPPQKVKPEKKAIKGNVDAGQEKQ